MASLECLKVDLSLIKPSIMITKAFDSTRRKAQGEIELMIEISLRSFIASFQVLLGRP